jgi:predicted transcriptional regulator
MFLKWAKGLRAVYFALASVVGLSGVGLVAVVASVAAATAGYITLGKAIDAVGEKADKNFDKFKMGEIPDRNRGQLNIGKEFESSLQIINEFESELSIAIPSATQKAINKFKEMNNGVLEDMKKKKENIRMIIAEGINSGITNMSKALSRSLVFGEKLSDTLKNMAQQVLSKIIAHLIEQIARQAISIAMENTQIGQLMTKLGIEKMITHEKTKQSVMKGISTGGDLLTGIMGSFASGGAVSKGNPILVGENGPELFVPNQTGQITQNARGTGGGSTNVNFNINTVDASGFEDLLVRSRGTITQLINSAVNERGSKNLI